VPGAGTKSSTHGPLEDIQDPKYSNSSVSLIIFFLVVLLITESRILKSLITVEFPLPFWQVLGERTSAENQTQGLTFDRQVSSLSVFALCIFDGLLLGTQGSNNSIF
jgi:hypothetical protein